MRLLDSITDSKDMNLSKLREVLKDRGVWYATVHGVSNSLTQLSDWTTTIFHCVCIYIPNLYPFIYWWSPEWLPYLWFLWKTLQWIRDCRYLFSILFSFPLSIYQEVGCVCSNLCSYQHFMAGEANGTPLQWGGIFLPGKSHGQRSLVGYSPWGREESNTTERLHFHFSLSCIGEGKGNPLQCSCLENPRDGGAW